MGGGGWMRWPLVSRVDWVRLECEGWILAFVGGGLKGCRDWGLLGGWCLGGGGGDSWLWVQTSRGSLGLGNRVGYSQGVVCQGKDNV